jgi:hypothetical protein
MRLRIALAAALLCVAGLLVLEMSQSAPRLAGTNHVNVSAFVAAVPANGTVCQPGTFLPSDAAQVQMLISTYGHTAPAIHATFEEAGREMAAGSLRGGGPQGYVMVPLSRLHRGNTGGTLCIRLHGRYAVAIGGAPAVAGTGSEQVNGKAQAGVLTLAFYRPDSESWWQLLPTLAQRLGLGKAAFFGAWMLPLATLLLLLIWIAAIRLLIKEGAA